MSLTSISIISFHNARMHLLHGLVETVKTGPLGNGESTKTTVLPTYLCFASLFQFIIVHIFKTIKLL